MPVNEEPSPANFTDVNTPVLDYIKPESLFKLWLPPEAELTNVIKSVSSAVFVGVIST